MPKRPEQTFPPKDKPKDPPKPKEPEKESPQ